MHAIPYRRRAGFTLIELSVVIVIIGLLVGGVLAGKNLIRSAELRSVITEANNYRTAINEFKTQYRYYPGDMPTATKYWGFAGTAAMPGCTSSTGIVTITAGGTCDGNGNNIVEYTAPAGNASEAFLFWQHLALAGIIQGSYSGLAAANNQYGYTFGVNSPASSVPQAGWGATYLNNSTASYGGIFQRDFRNWLSVGTLVKDNAYADTPFLKADEAFSIDTKMDDGLPGSGNVEAAYDIGWGFGTAYVACSNAKTETDYGTTYHITNTADNVCALLFKY